MKALESFTICPSKGLSADSKENGDSSVPSFLHNKRSSFRPIQRGTVLQNWNGSKDSFSLDRDAGRVIRASPFEPGIHDRNFPKSGTISPLNSEEYQAWKNREGTVNNIKESPHSSPPQIMQKPQASGIDIVRVTGCFPDVCSKRENSDVSWETRFLKSEVERTQMSEKLMAVIEENRTLRIETISLSAALFCEKNKTRKASIQMNDVKINNEDPLVCYEDEQKCNSDVAEKSTTCFSKVTAHKKVSLPSSNDQPSESDEFMIYTNNNCGKHITRHGKITATTLVLSILKIFWCN